MDSPDSSPQTRPQDQHPHPSPIDRGAQSQNSPPPLSLPTIARLQHASSSTCLDLGADTFVWRLGKPHHGAYPDLDLSHLPQAEIVSRSHALIRYHRGQYYIEDTNSSNGTYVNNQLLVPGRHYPLKHNDCIALGKGNLVQFFFQIGAD